MALMASLPLSVLYITMFYLLVGTSSAAQCSIRESTAEAGRINIWCTTIVLPT
jgi:hypothetical protein